MMLALNEFWTNVDAEAVAWYESFGKLMVSWRP